MLKHDVVNKYEVLGLKSVFGILNNRRHDYDIVERTEHFTFNGSPRVV